METPDRPPKPTSMLPLVLAIFGALSCLTAGVLTMLASCLDVPSPCMPSGTETAAGLLAVLGLLLLFGGIAPVLGKRS